MKINRRKVARSRIEILMQKAEEVYPSDRELANRYASLAKKLSTRHNAAFPQKWKKRVCKKCGNFLAPGSNCRVRTHRSRVTMTCLGCGHIARSPFK